MNLRNLFVAALIAGVFVPAASAQDNLKLTDDEKIQWYCAQHSDEGANCASHARMLLPYISDYAKYSDVDSRGNPYTPDSAGCDFSPLPPGCPGAAAVPAPTPAPTPAPAPAHPPSPAPAPQPGAACPAGGTVSGRYTANGLQRPSIARGGYVSYEMPHYASPGLVNEILSIQSTSAQSNLTVEFSLSTCPGEFTNVPAECKTWGSVNTSGTQLFAITSRTPVPGTCTLIIGRTYYLNARNVKIDRVTPSCTPAACSMIVQLNSFTL